MKNIFRKISLLALSAVALAGCGGTSVSLPNEAESFAIFEDIATSVPLILEVGTGKEVYTNALRNQEDPVMPVPALKEGRDLTLTTQVTRSNQKISVSWDFRKGDTLGTFTFVENAPNKDGIVTLTATPGYEEFEPIDELTPTPLPKTGRLIATMKLGEFTKSYNVDMFLHAVEKINYYSLIGVRDVTGDGYVGVRGYLTGVFEDWNNATIGDGKYALGLFKLGDYREEFAVGDFVDVVGKYTAYNGLNQLQFIRSVKHADPADFPEAKQPIVNEFTMDQLKEQILDLPGTGSEAMVGPLFDYDGALVKFNAPFKFKEVRDRNNAPITLAQMDVTENVHYDIVLEGKTSTDQKFEVKVSLNYHIGTKRVAIKQFFVDNATKDISYEGHLGWYNTLNLAPYDVSSFSAK